MAHFHIEGLYPYDGDHGIDLENLTNRELHTIKEISGVRASEMWEAFSSGDNDLLVAFAEIALKRAGLAVNRDVLWDAPVGAIQFIVEEEDEASPPSQPPSEPAETEKPSEQPQDSGADSEPAGESPASVPSPTGSPLSAIGSPSVQKTSVS